MKKNNLEIKIYELLGVKKFKKLTFELESLIHKKDGGFNVNYHAYIEKKSEDNINTIDKFKKFLYYNGFIHVKNSAMLIISILSLTIINGIQIYTIPMVLLLIKDLYCIMLQRYNWIRISQHRDRLVQRRTKKISNEIIKMKSNNIKQDLKYDNNELRQTLEKLKLYIEQSKKVEFDEQSLKSLSIVNEVLTNEEISSFTRVRK